MTSSTILIIGSQTEEVSALQQAAESEQLEVRHVPSTDAIPAREDFDPSLFVFTSDVPSPALASVLPEDPSRTRHIRVIGAEAWENVERSRFLAVFDNQASASELRYRLSEAITRLELMRRMRLSTSGWSQGNGWGELLSSADFVTGLDNRMRFLSELNRTISMSKRYKRPFCCVLARLSNFRALYQELGQEPMDMLLEEVAGIFEVSIRDTDILARVQVDLFGLILTETDLEHAHNVIERIQGMIASFPFSEHREELSGLSEALNMSFGIVSCDEHSTPESLLASAESHLSQTELDAVGA